MMSNADGSWRHGDNVFYDTASAIQNGAPQAVYGTRVTPDTAMDVGTDWLVFCGQNSLPYKILI